MSDSGWDDEFEHAFAAIVSSWEASEAEVEWLKQFAVEFYGRFYAVLATTLEEQIAGLVAAGLSSQPDLLEPTKAATLAIALWLPPGLGMDLMSAYMELAMKTVWADPAAHGVEMGDEDELRAP